MVVNEFKFINKSILSPQRQLNKTYSNFGNTALFISDNFELFL